MIASIFSMLPSILMVVFSIGITWLILKLWYSNNYIHKTEVRPLQESQHIMQNQYAILAERIKHTETQLNESKIKLEQALVEREDALLQLKELKLTATTVESTPSELVELKQLVNEIKDMLNTKVIVPTGEEKANRNDQINLLRQNIKEFKTEFVQKINSSNNQFNELSNQLWQLIELNKKLNQETEELSRFVQNPSNPADENALPERPFTLTSIKKRS